MTLLQIYPFPLYYIKCTNMKYTWISLSHVYNGYTLFVIRNNPCNILPTRCHKDVSYFSIHSVCSTIRDFLYYQFWCTHVKYSLHMYQHFSMKKPKSLVKMICGLQKIPLECWHIKPLITDSKCCMTKS